MTAGADPSQFRFLFDFISHNAWLAWGRARDLARAHGLEFEPVPVLFGAMLKAAGQLGPAEIPGKNRWMLKDVLRKSIQYGIPIAPPHSHPFNPIAALRLACCDLPAPERVRLIEGLFQATWVQSRDMSDPGVLGAVADGAGLEGARLLEESAGEAAKACLRRNTDDALAAGAFGVPTMLVRGRLFWGFDDLVNLDAFLCGRDPFERSGDLAAWSAVRPSIQRTR